MSWLLVGCYGLVLMNISGAQTIRQRPRFIGAKTKRQVSISCSASAGVVQWYRLNKYNENRNKALEVKAGGRVSVPSPGAKLHISDLRVEDKGVYFCKVNNTWGCGTELQVSKSTNREKAQYRTNLKDGLIIVQALLLAVFTAAIMLRKQTLENSDNDYEQPEDDHIYEGLMIETCGGSPYEELSIYAQPEAAEASWD